MTCIYGNLKENTIGCNGKQYYRSMMIFGILFDYI